MNIDLEAIRSLQLNREAICEDMALRSQSEQLRGYRAQARLERMNKARVNALTLARLTQEAQGFETRVDQYSRLFKILRCPRE
jgi:hypothetical protein